MKILIETECGEDECGQCIGVCTAREPFCHIFHAQLVWRDTDTPWSTRPTRCRACLAKYHAPSTTPEQHAADEYAKQLADCRKLNMHTMEVE